MAARSSGTLMSEGKNAARDGKCTRSTRCTKGKGHAGWCKTKTGADAVDQDSLFASLSSRERRQQPARTGGVQANRAAGMQELARRREGSKRGRNSRILDDDEEDEDEDEEGEDYEEEEEEGEEEEEEEGTGGVEYADHGLSRAERRAMRGGGSQADAGGDVVKEEDGVGGSWESGGEPAQLAEIPNICLKRQMLEKWLLEPFFARVVRGCVVRIGLTTSGAGGAGGEATSTLYRVAEVVGIKDFDDAPYSLGQRRTTKKLLLDFGEARQWYQMSSVSNQPFDELELRSWQQVLEVGAKSMISANQLKAKYAELKQASHYEYSEADVTRRIEEERKAAAHAGKPSTLTTRQKLLQQHAGGQQARPKKFQRNVLGQAFVTEHE